RIREAAGTIYFDTSPDNTTWTTLNSTPAPFQTNAVYLHLATGSWDPEPGGTTIWLNFNSTAAAKTTASWHWAVTDPIPNYTFAGDSCYQGAAVAPDGQTVFIANLTTNV